MPESMRVVLGLVLGTIGVLGAMVGPARARTNAAINIRHGRPPLRSSRSSRGSGPYAGSPSTGVPAVSGDDDRRTGIEARIRPLVAEQLGVDAEKLVPEVSLTDEFAADSLDLAELVVVLESELGIEVVKRGIDGVRT